MLVMMGGGGGARCSWVGSGGVWGLSPTLTTHKYERTNTQVLRLEEKIREAEARVQEAEQQGQAWQAVRHSFVVVVVCWLCPQVFVVSSSSQLLPLCCVLTSSPFPPFLPTKMTNNTAAVRGVRAGSHGAARGHGGRPPDVRTHNPVILTG